MRSPCQTLIFSCFLLLLLFCGYFTRSPTVYANYDLHKSDSSINVENEADKFQKDRRRTGIDIGWTDDIDWGDDDTDGGAEEGGEKNGGENGKGDDGKKGKDDKGGDKGKGRGAGGDQGGRPQPRPRPQPAPQPPPPPVRSLSFNESLLAKWLAQKNIGFPEDWMRLSPAMRAQLLRQYMQDSMARRTGMPGSVSPVNREALFGEFGNASLQELRERFSGGSGVDRWWAPQGKGVSAGGAYAESADKYGNNANRPPRGTWGPWPGETEQEWKTRVSQNIWQTTYDRVLRERQQERINRERMGVRNSAINEYQYQQSVQASGIDPRAEADKAWAKYMADQAAKNAYNPNYQNWLKTVSEAELVKMNMHRDGTPIVAYGVAHRGSGMGPTLDWSRPDAAEAADRQARADFNQWQRDRTAHSQARNAALRVQRAADREARDAALRDKRIQRAQASQNAGGGQVREPATATWTDANGNTVTWTSSGNTRSITTTSSSGGVKTETITRQPGSASASYQDTSGNTHQFERSGGQTTHTVTNSSGQTAAQPVVSWGNQASASYTDTNGSRVTVTQSGADSRTIQTTSPAGNSTTRTIFTGTGNVTAVWKDASGNTHILNQQGGSSTRTQTTIARTGQTTTRSFDASSSVPTAAYTDNSGNRITLTRNSDGTRTQTVQASDGTTTVSTIDNRGSFASWTDAEGNKRTLTSNGDGSRTMTLTPAEGGKTTTSVVRDPEVSLISTTTPDGTQITVAGLPGGRREITTTDPGGNSTTVVRGGEPDSAASSLPDGTVVRATNLGGGKREITTTRPDGTTSIQSAGNEPVSVSSTTPDGNKITVTARPDGIREVTVERPDGLSTTTVHGNEPDSAVVTREDGTTVRVTSLGGGKQEVITTTPGGKTETEIREPGQPAMASITNPDGNVVTVVDRGDGKREVITTTPQGETTRKVQSPGPASVTVTREDGTQVTVTNRGDGKQEVTTVTSDGKTETEVRDQNNLAMVETVDQEGTKITVVDRGDGTREVMTTTRDGKTKTEIHGNEPDSATSVDKDGYTTTGVKTEDGKIDVSTNRPEEPKTPQETPAAAPGVQPEGEGEKKPETKAEADEPAISTAWTDTEGNKHEISVTSDGTKVDVTESADGTRSRVETRSDGTTIETTTSTENETTVTTTAKNQAGQIVRHTENPDGTTETVTTDPKTGNVTTRTHDPNNRSGPYSQGAETMVTRDSDGNVLEETTVDRYGNKKTVKHNPDGTTTVTEQSRGDTESAELNLTDSGFGTETVRDENGNIVKENKVLVVTETNEYGQTIRYKVNPDGTYQGEVLNEDGTVSAYTSGELGDEGAPDVDRGRFLYEEQRKELGLTRTWEDLSGSDRREYAREQERLDEVKARREREESDRRALELLRQRQKEQAEQEDRDLQRQIKEDRERIQREYEANEARIEAEQKAKVAKAAEARRAEEKRAQEEAYRARQQQIFTDRFEREVQNPNDKNEVREWQVKIRMERLRQIRVQNQIAADSGSVDIVAEDGTTTQRALTPQQIQDAKTRVHLIDNLERILQVEDGNQIARLETVKAYGDIVAAKTYVGDPREVYANQLSGDTYNLKDFRDAREKSDNAVVEALESAAITRASVNTRQQVDEGLMVGTEAIARGLNDWFTSLNPADPFLQAGLGVKTSGADIGRKLSTGERVFQGTVGVVETAVDIGVGKGIQDLTRQPGSARVLPTGSQRNRNFDYDLDTGMPRGSTRSLDAPDLPTGSARSLDTPDLPTRGGGLKIRGQLDTEADLGITTDLLNARRGQSGIGRPTGVRDTPAPTGPYQSTPAPRGALPTEADLGISGNLLDARIGKSGLHPETPNMPTGGRATGAPVPSAGPVGRTGPGDTQVLSGNQVRTGPGDTQVLSGNGVRTGPGSTQVVDGHSFGQSSQGVGPTGTQAGALRAPQINGGSPRGVQIPQGTSLADTPYPRGLGDADLTSVQHGGMDIDLRAGAKPPKNLSSEQLQEWNDVRSQHQTIMNQRAGHPGSDGGDDLFPAPPGIGPLPRPGELSEGLSPQQLDGLFQGGISRQLPNGDVAIKADAIASGRNPNPLGNNPDFRNAANQKFGRAPQNSDGNPALNGETVIGGAQPAGTHVFNDSFEVPGAGTQVINQTPITRNDGNAISGGAANRVSLDAQSGVPIQSRNRPTVDSAQRGQDVTPPAPVQRGDDALKIKPIVERRLVSDDRVYGALPPQQMDPDFIARNPDFQYNPQAAAQRVQHWQQNPDLEGVVDAEMREMLKLGADAGSPGARRVLENDPAYTYQVDMDGPYGAMDSQGGNVIRLNPFKAHPQVPADTLQRRSPLAIAGTMVHEAGHGRGMTGQIPARGGGDAPAISPPKPGTKDLPLGQGQGAGYNEFRAFYEEAAFYYRVGKKNPELLDGLEPSNRRLHDGFKKAYEEGGTTAAKNFINKEIADRQYERFYPTPESYARGTTQQGGGSSLRATQAQNRGETPQQMTPSHIDIDNVFPQPKVAQLPPGGAQPLPPLPPPPPPLPGVRQGPTIQYPNGAAKPSSGTAGAPGSTQVKGSVSREGASGESVDSGGMVTGVMGVVHSDSTIRANDLSANIQQQTKAGVQAGMALKEDSTFQEDEKRSEPRGFFSRLFNADK